MFIAVTMYPMFKYIHVKQTLTGGCTYEESRPLLLRAETPEFTSKHNIFMFSVQKSRLVRGGNLSIENVSFHIFTSVEISL